MKGSGKVDPEPKEEMEEESRRQELKNRQLVMSVGHLIAHFFTNFFYNTPLSSLRIYYPDKLPKMNRTALFIIPPPATCSLIDYMYLAVKTLSRSATESTQRIACYCLILGFCSGVPFVIVYIVMQFLPRCH